MSIFEQFNLLSEDLDQSYKSHGCLKSDHPIYDSISPEEYLKKRPKWVPSFMLTKSDSSVCKTNSYPFCLSMDVETSNRYSAQYIALHNFSKESHSGSIFHSISTCAVLVIGAGGLGSPVLMYLASSGVGLIGIMDGDVVEVSNLHRQIIHDESFLGENKARSAKDRLSKINSKGRYIAYEFYFGVKEAHEILPLYDVIVDASDNPQTKYLINDACILYNKPYVIASCIKGQGQLMVFNRLRLVMEDEHLNGNGMTNGFSEDNMNKSEKNQDKELYNDNDNKNKNKNKKMPCFRCICPDEGNPSISFVKNACSAAGVLGSIPGILGTIQATEVLKLCAGTFDTSLSPGRLLMYDAMNPVNPFRTLELSRNKNCRVCGDNVKSIQLKMYETVEGKSNLDRDYLAISQEEFWKIYMEQLPNGLPVSVKLRLTDEEMVLDSNGEEFLIYLIDVRPSPHFYICHLPGSISWPLDDVLNSTLTPKLFNKIDSFSNINYNTNTTSSSNSNSNIFNDTTNNSVNGDSMTNGFSNGNTNKSQKNQDTPKVLLLTICRRGNTSRTAATAIRNLLSQNKSHNKILCYSVAGGMHYLSTHLKLKIPKT